MKLFLKTTALSMLIQKPWVQITQLVHARAKYLSLQDPHPASLVEHVLGTGHYCWLRRKLTAPVILPDPSPVQLHVRAELKGNLHSNGKRKLAFAEYHGVGNNKSRCRQNGNESFLQLLRCFLETRVVAEEVKSG